MNATNKVGLVLEGGGLRCLFTSGVIDVLMEHGIDFPATAGVSGGVLFGCNYKSRQPGRALRYNIRFKDEPRYMSWKSLRQTGNYVNDEFSYHKLPYELDPMDFKTYRENSMEFYVVCTDIEEGKPVYRRIDDADGEGLEWFKASSSMPVFAKPVEIDGHYYLDGGITDSIPLKFLEGRGYGKNVVVLTQPKDYKKKKAQLYLLLRLWHRKFPKVAQLMRVRHKMYNAQLDYIAEQTRQRCATCTRLGAEKPRKCFRGCLSFLKVNNELSNISNNYEGTPHCIFIAGSAFFVSLNHNYCYFCI